MHKTLQEEIQEALAAAAGYRDPQPETRFHRHREYLAYGLRAAELWQILKRFRQEILAQPLAERLALAAGLLATHIGEPGHAGIYVLALSVAELGPAHFSYLGERLDDFRSWSHVDHLCGEVMQPLLYAYEQETLALLEAWSRSPNRWKRRASVVTFTRKVGESGAYTAQALALCDRLAWDEEDIVQKGVGWALKDNLRGAPVQVLSYIKELRRQGAPSTVTLYAIRDLKGEERQAVLAIKKEKDASGRRQGSA